MRTEVLSMICQVLEGYEESVTSEQNLKGQPQTGQEDLSVPPFLRKPPTPIQTDSCQQIKEIDIEATLRKALGLKDQILWLSCIDPPTSYLVSPHNMPYQDNSG